MPNFRLSDAADSSDLCIHLAVGVHRFPAPTETGQCRPRQGAIRDARLSGVSFDRRRRSDLQGGTFAANLTRVGEKDNYDYLVRWIHNARERTRPYCPYEKKDIGPEDYAKKGLPYVFDLRHSQCPNDGHELQVQNMTVMPSLRLSVEDAQDIATYLMTQKKQEPSAYADASFMDDPKLKDEGKKWIRHYGCAGCHEIAGIEEEGRIGTELTFEGSKPIERLDFALFTEEAQRGGKRADYQILRIWLVLPEGPAKTSWYDHKGFFEHKLAEPDDFRQGQGQVGDGKAAHAEPAPQ